MIDLYKLKIFTLVAQTGSFTKTADVLLLSQSAISQHVKNLEQNLGAKLFERGRHGAVLTQEGETLLLYARQILQLTATAVNAVTNVANLKDGELRLGATHLAGSYILPTWIRMFRQQYPNLRVLLKTVSAAEMIVALHTHQLDLGFTTGWTLPKDPLLNVQVLQEIDMALVVGKNHAWCEREQIALEELNGRSLIMRPPHKPTRRWLDAFFLRHNIKPKTVLVSDELEAVKRTISEGQCAAFLPACTIVRELACGDLFGLTVPEIEQKPMLTLIWPQKRPFTPISRAFIATLRQTYPSLQALLD